MNAELENMIAKVIRKMDNFRQPWSEIIFSDGPKG